MSQFFSIHPDNPEARLIRKACEILKKNGLIVYPTDSGYALGCILGNKIAVDRIRKLRQLDEDHNMTLVCNNLARLDLYADLDPVLFRILKVCIPGPYTFILKATKEIPRLMQHIKRKTVGLRVPANSIALSLLDALDAPLMSSTLILPAAKAPLSEPAAIRDLLGSQVDLIIDGGLCDHNPTTVVDLTGLRPIILRQGKGDTGPFL